MPTATLATATKRLPGPPPLKAPRGSRAILTTAERSAGLATGREIAASAAKRERLWFRFRRGKATDADRQRLATRITLDATHEVKALADRLIAGTISRPSWEARMRAVVVPRIYAGTIAALPGELTADDLAGIESDITAHVGYLKRFRADIATGKQARDGTLRNRATLYGGAVWSVGQNAVLRRMLADKSGRWEGRRVLGASDHCRAGKGRPGCIEEAAKGWQSVAKVVPIGGCRCHSRCHCSIIFRKQRASQQKGSSGTVPPAASTQAARPSLLGRLWEWPGKAARAAIAGVRRLAGR